MTVYRHREETVNTQLAILLSRLGVKAEAETILCSGRELPDVLFNMRGMRVAIEGKFADHANAESLSLKQSKQRVKDGLAHIAVAVIYPKSLREVTTTELLSRLESANLSFLIVSEAGDTNWFRGTPASVLETLRRIQQTLAADEIVEETAKSLNDRLQVISLLWMEQAAVCDRLSHVLGISPPAGETRDNAKKRRETATKVAALAIANALIFQEQIASTKADVLPLRNLENEESPVGTTVELWQWIWKNVDYAPIFQLGERILRELPVSRNTNSAFKALLLEAKAICEKQTALRHDLMGRIFHWLLHHAKYHGAYYTSVSSATLLLKLAFSSDWETDFGDLRQLSEFKVSDLACGTGTLLMAASHAITDAFIRARASTGRNLNPVDLQGFHRNLMENVLYGYDVLPSAVHLTASTLALLAPEVTFSRMNLFAMPLGVFDEKPRLGSLDFLDRPVAETQLTLNGTHKDIVRADITETRAAPAQIPKSNLCVMNPPFVRSVGGNLLFGSFPDERRLLQKELKRRVKKIGANITAGLGSVFIALADIHLAGGGRLAIVLPAALASGEAWAETRKLLAEKYDLELVVSSHDAARPNFSENTNLSEVLFIARKLGENNRKKGRTHYINLLRNPRSIYSALDLANNIRTALSGDAISLGKKSLISNDKKVAEIIISDSPRGRGNWDGALFAHEELMQTFIVLKQGKLAAPGAEKTFNLILSELKSIGSVGYDRRDIHDAFKVSKVDWSPYPALWDHDASIINTISQKPNSFLLIRERPSKGRPRKNAKSVWDKAANILIAERLRLNTHSILAIYLNVNALGNTWWALNNNCLSVKQQKALLLWLNCTLSLLLYYGRRVITQGAWVMMKKPAWESMPVLDVRRLTDNQLSALSESFDRLSESKLLPIAQLAGDPVRKEIDDAISSALGLPDLAAIRELLGREPGLCGKSLSTGPGGFD